MNCPWHTTWCDYHIEDLSSPPEEIDETMVDEDRMILMREMNMHVLSGIRSFNNQRSPIVFTCTSHVHECTHNTFLVTSQESRSGIVNCGSGKEHCICSELFDP